MRAFQMEVAEFLQIQRELNLKSPEVAAILDVTPDIVSKWRCGRSPITGPVATTMRLLRKYPQEVNHANS